MARDLPQVYSDSPLTSFEDGDLFYVVRGQTNCGTTYADLLAAFGGSSVPTQITVANEASDTTCFPAFFTGATGDLGPKTNASLAFNSSTGVLTAAGFVGNLTGTASNSSAVTAADEAADATCFPLFVTAATGSLAPKTNAGLTFDALTSTLHSEVFTATTATITTLTVTSGLTINTDGGLSVGGFNINLGGNLSTSSTLSTSGHVLTFNGVAYTFPGMTASLASLAAPTFTGQVSADTLLTGSGNTRVLLSNASSLGGIWIGGNTATPTTSNYSMLFDGSNTLVNTITGGGVILRVNNTSILTIAASAITVADATNIVLNTSTGTKIGTATGQKLSFWNATPVVQQVLATGTGATVDNVITLLQTLGLCKQS